MSAVGPPDLGTLRALAVMRIMWGYNWLGLSSYAWHVRHGPEQLEQLPAEVWHPVSIARWFDAPPSAGFGHFVGAVAVSSVVLLMLGVWTRGMSAVCFAGNTLLMCLAMSWGKIGHNTQVLMLFLLVLSFSDWGHCWSVDSLVRRLRGRGGRGHPTPHPAWPIWMCTFVLAFLYVSSGLHKLVRGEFLGDGFHQFLKWRLVYWEQASGGAPPVWVVDLVSRALEHPALVWGASLGALLFEAGFFVALLSRRLRLLMLCGVFVFHGLIGVLAGMYFLSPMIAAALVLVPTVILALRGRGGLLGRLFPARPDPASGGGRRMPPVWARTSIGLVAATCTLLLAAPYVPADFRAAWPATVTDTLTDSSVFLAVGHRRFVIIAAVSAAPCAIVAGWMLIGVLRVLRGRPAPRERILLYDGDCGFCRRWCDWARARGAEATVRFETCQSAAALRERAGISKAACAESAFLVEIQDEAVVRVRPAAAAINGVLAALPGLRNAPLRCLSMLYGLEGFRQVEDVGYRWVARWRGRLGGGSCSAE